MTLSRRNQELADLHELKDRMFQNVSHELRTPLTMMLTPLQRRLARNEDSEEERRWTDEMYRNGMRLLKQINDLLDLARLDSSGVPVDRKVVDVQSVLEHLLDDLGTSADAAGVSMRLIASEEPHVYVLDPYHLERIVLNLLANAIKFTPAGGSVLVFLVGTSDGLEISVEDSGPGIPREEQTGVFDRFRQIDSGTTRSYGGSGIGLALVRELAELMEGSVEVESEEGQGSRFTVRLPAVAAIDRIDRSQGDLAWGMEPLYRQADREALRFGSDSGERMLAGGGGPSVLVVEDDDRLRRHLVEILAEEHRVVGVARGEEALREALLFRPQVVVSDVMMPGMDGVELCRRLRERGELRHTAVILLTAKGRLEDRIEGRRVGADSYLTKPFEVRELLATVEGLLRARMHLVGEYLVQRPLGRGGQSEVWLAEHRTTGERVALKVIRPSGLEDVRARERLRREHEALLRLEHSNIVRIVARGEQAGGLYLAMEYLEGATLDELVRSSGALPPEAVASIGRSVAAALGHVHRSGLVHRDVKCSNVMLLKEDQALERRVRLIDFGTAAAVERGKNRSDRVVGSLPYLAPELLLNTASASPATDIYGLGVVMYRLATGSLPHRGSTAGELIDAFTRGPAPCLETAAPDMPAALSTAIERAMERDSAARWQAAEDIENSLKGFPNSRIRLSFPESRVSLGPTATFDRGGSSVSATTRQ
jgi:serine/threonine protein kinase/two-component sensor histidine kinase